MVNIDKYGVKISDDCKTEPRVQMSDNVIVYENLKYRIKDDSAYLIGVDDENKLSCSLVIPDQIIVEGEAIPVIGIDESAVTSWNRFSKVISIIIPDSITYVGSGNFRELDRLQSIVIGNGVKELDYCLVYCESLCSIVCNENLKFLQNVYSGSIRETKWYQLQPYGSVCLGATLIGYKLAPNEELKQYKVPDNVRYIMDGALDECEDLQSIDLNNVEIVDCSLPDNITSIVASGDSLQETESFDNTIWYKNQPCGCVNIGSLLYRYKKGDTITPSSIQLPQQTRIINKQAFSSIDEEWNEYGEPYAVICNKELVCIGESAFEDSAVTEINLSKELVEIKDSAFKDSSLCAINFPEGLQKIGKEAFSGCQLKNIIIPASLREIPESAFARNEHLSCVHFVGDYYADLGRIGNGAFAECDIRSIHIPGSVDEIGDSAFYNNRSLMNISLSEGVKSIGNCAFSSEHGVRGLRLLDIPSSVTYIGSQAFNTTFYDEEEFRFGELYPASNTDNNEVETLIVGSDVLDRCWVSTIGRRLETVILKEGVTIIPEYCFKDCDKLTNIIFPSTLTTIKPSAFIGCESLETLILPSNIEELWSDSLPLNIKKVILLSGKLKLKIGVYGKERLDYYINNRVFIDTDGKNIEPKVVIFEIDDENEDGQYYYDGRYCDIKIVDDFEEPEDSEPDDIDEDGNYRSSYSQYGGYNGYDDDTINSAFEGDPEATWNVD